MSLCAAFRKLAISSAVVVFALTSLDAHAQENGQDITLSENAGASGSTQSYVAATFGSWEQHCISTNDGVDPCQLYQLLMDAQGAPVSEISVFALPPGKEAAAGATVIAPLETLLTESLTIAIDGTSKIYPFSYCTLTGCVSRVGFTGIELEKLIRGAKVTLTVVPAAEREKRVTLDVSLLGFSTGFAASAATVNTVSSTRLGENSQNTAIAPIKQKTVTLPWGQTQRVQTPLVGGCEENGSCYGDLSTLTGRPKTVQVDGYHRRDGTYVRGHYRSKPKN